MGKGKKPGEAQSEHVSRPLATLKDPTSFGPPPKHVNYHGGAALPNEITPHTSGIGAPLSQTEVATANTAVQSQPAEEMEEQQRLAGPPLPYRADRTGLQTSHLPPPPVHRSLASAPLPDTAQPAKPQPRLPPRLPTRQSSTDVAAPISSPSPSYEAVIPPPPAPSTNGGLNTSALNRLGNAGISVPGFGIGRNNDAASTNPWKSERSNNATSPQPPTTSGTNALSELQSRFSRMNSPTSNNSTTSPTPNTTSPQTTPPPPTWQQSQSAVRTASNFHRNPSSVSAADAKSAATTAQAAGQSAAAFREKHKESINAAGQRANAFNQKYKVQTRFEKFLDKHAPLEEGQQQQTQQPQAAQPGYIQPPPQQAFSPATQISPSPIQPPSPELTASISRKPPPPPPPKKPAGMYGNATGAAAPPVPLGTKPSYS